MERFVPSPEPDGRVTVTMVGRMLWSKGVAEMVAAARILHTRGMEIRVRLVGAPDPENPESVPPDALRAWVAEGIVEWNGHEDDMPGVLRATHIAVLLTYREGLPMTLLEAAASGRPIVASDVPGCREIVRDGVNGVLVAPRDATALADAIQALAGDRARRLEMGRRGRELVSAFSHEVVARETLALYRDMLTGIDPTHG
jgi:glycosyltransferase involved in cell wall biosynthesis